MSHKFLRSSRDRMLEGLKVLGYVNKFNRGIARVKKDLIDNGNGDANFRVEKLTVFEVIINDASVLDISTKTSTKNKTVTKLLNAINENPQITRKQLAEILEISIQGVGWQLEQLKKKGVIVRDGANRGGKWIIVSKQQD